MIKIFLLAIFSAIFFCHNFLLAQTEQQPQKKEDMRSIKLKKNEKKKSWKRLDSEISHIKKGLQENPKNVYSVSSLALLELYKENYAKSYKYFNLLKKLKPESLHIFYRNMSLSIISPVEGEKEWKNYFSSVHSHKEKQIWKILAQSVKNIPYQRSSKGKEKFRKQIYWFFKNKAYYTSFMAATIFEKYLVGKEREEKIKDEEFVREIKAGVLVKMGYVLDAIDYLEKWEKIEGGLTEKLQKKLAFAYYHSQQYEKAIKKLNKLENVNQKTPAYYYYLSLAYLQNGEIDQHKKIMDILAQKKDKKSHILLQKIKNRYSSDALRQVSFNTN